jgi:hypothetical protein
MLVLLLSLFACASADADHDWPAECPDPTDPDVTYLHDTWAERGDCALIDFGCDDEYISNVTDADCGCGCITGSAAR